MSNPLIRFETEREIRVPFDASIPIRVAAIAASTRLLPDGRLEFQRYVMGGVRVTMLLVAFLWAAITFGALWSVGVSPAAQARLLFFPEAHWGAYYDARTAEGRPPVQFADGLSTVELERTEFIAYQLEKRSLADSNLQMAVVSFIPVISLLAAVFLWPRSTPLYIDRARQAIYTKRLFTLIAIPIRAGTIDIVATIRPALSIQRTLAWGPLMLELRCLGSDTTKRTAVGVFPAAHPDQHIHLFHAMRSFAAANDVPDWVGDLNTYRAGMRPSPLRMILMGLFFRRRITARDFAQIDAMR